MKEALLEQIKRELLEEKGFQDAYNKDVRAKNKRSKEEVRMIKSIGATPMRMYIDRRTKGDILLRLLRKHRDEIKEEDTNGIYVYFATYREKNNFYEDGPEDIKVPFNDKNATYSLYRNLEIDKEVLISIDEREEFERTVDIVTGDYRSLQKEFITTAVKKGQEEAAKQIVKRYRRSFDYED